MLGFASCEVLNAQTSRKLFIVLDGYAPDLVDDYVYGVDRKGKEQLEPKYFDYLNYIKRGGDAPKMGVRFKESSDVTGRGSPQTFAFTDIGLEKGDPLEIAFVDVKKRLTADGEQIVEVVKHDGSVSLVFVEDWATESELKFGVIPKGEQFSFLNFTVPKAALDPTTNRFLRQQPSDYLGGKKAKYISLDKLKITFLSTDDSGSPIVDIAIALERSTLPETIKPPVVERLWTLKDGTTFDATFAAYSAGRIKIRLADGESRVIRFRELSADDQEYVRKVR